ncbi:DUF2628 domain-containing protein [Tsukamurella ocularis]|uniref:DUF2628 domain-containing protein n=1 Tax=Tsukamurella ocularis TaxID=1970234 RepID=UPI00216A22CF|nr:DUF2628 domain-containing protein [Tsukamurella ocularis]MCS3781296.1 hypothetical protein [Tsukamurella ocularis]MCS3787667.1 hypothetical protein [Tsukamurella ocularis]MCS3850962.1 hypothetical protein [Tsukamurella ocularis]
MTENSVPPQYPIDPQNPYGQQYPQQPFGQQQPHPGPAVDVPERWRSRFDFYSRYGQPASSPEATAAFKQLSFGQRFRLGFNGPAFFFGPIYYAIKGPWRKGLSLFGIAVAITIVISMIEILLNFTFPGASYSVVIGLLYSTTANWSYFLHAARGSTSWNPFEGTPLLRKRS